MMTRTVKAWCGFTDDKPDLDALRKEGGISTDGYAVLYRTRKQAKQYYQDVRRVEITYRETPERSTQS